MIPVPESGTDTDTDTELFWGSNAAIWNTGGDTIIVKDDSGENVTVQTYS